MIKLNLGSHGNNMVGYTNVDLFDQRADLKANAIDLPFQDNEIDEILAWHLLEHFPMADYELHLCNPTNLTLVEDVLKHWHSKLKLGGILSLKVPDFEKIVYLFYKFPQWAREGGPGGIFPNYAYWLTGNGQHGACFDKTSMSAILNKVGFKDIKYLDPPLTGMPDRSNLELFVECIK